MRASYIVAMLGVIIASPAFAGPGYEAKTQRAWQATSHDGYGGRHRFGTDPDPNVRFENLRQRNWRKG
jgi:hypothetical protein